MTTSDSEDIQPPYVKGFVMILPDGVSIPDQTTWACETDELEPLLDGVGWRPTPSVKSPIPSDGVGRNLVSLRFWQVGDESASPFTTDVRHLLKAFNRVHPRPDSGTASLACLDDEVVDLPRYRTIVEAVTFVACAEDLVASRTKPDPLTRCLDALFEFHRAYRIASNTPTEELTYAQLCPLVLTFRRALSDDVVTPDGIMHLSDNLKFGPLTEHIGSVDLTQVAEGVTRIRFGDPVLTFVERQNDARHELTVKGRYANAVIQLAIACEVVLDGLLGLALWEEGVSDTDAAAVFSSDITPRLKSEYGSRFGGNWSLDTGILSSWFEDVAGLRNRIVHAGYQPTAAEAKRADAVVVTLAEKISDRLCDKFRRYPRTAWLFLGQAGFERRSRYSSRVKTWIDDQPANAVLDWLRDYSKWRDSVDAQVQRRRRSSP